MHALPHIFLCHVVAVNPCGPELFHLAPPRWGPDLNDLCFVPMIFPIYALSPWFSPMIPFMHCPHGSSMIPFMHCPHGSSPWFSPMIPFMHCPHGSPHFATSRVGPNTWTRSVAIARIGVTIFAAEPANSSQRPNAVASGSFDVASPSHSCRRRFSHSFLESPARRKFDASSTPAAKLR